MTAPIAVAALSFVAILVFWPGAVLGVSALLLIAWACAKLAARAGREHHY